MSDTSTPKVDPLVRYVWFRWSAEEEQRWQLRQAIRELAK